MVLALPVVSITFSMSKEYHRYESKKMYWNCKPVCVHMATSNDEIAKVASNDEVATSAPPSMAQSI